DGIRDDLVTGVQTCALPISLPPPHREAAANARMLPRLVPPAFHDGAGASARGAHSLHPPAPEGSSLPSRSDRPLVSAGSDDLLGSRGAAHRTDRHALLRPLPVG